MALTLFASASTFSAPEPTGDTLCTLRDRKILATVTKIRALSNGSSLELAQAIGAVVVEEVYAGNLERWRVRRAKDTSLRRLARHPMLPVSAATLYRAIAIYELSVHVGGLQRWPGLGPAEVRAVLGLPREAQISLLDEAAACGLSARELREKAATVTRGKQRGGRPATNHIVKCLRTIGRTVRRNSLWIDDRERIEALDEGSRNYIREELADIRHQLEVLARCFASAS